MLTSFSGYCLYIRPISFNDTSLQLFFDCRIAKERVHLAYKHPELLLDLMKKGVISTSLACNDLEVNISVCQSRPAGRHLWSEKQKNINTFLVAIIYVLLG